MWGLAVLLVLNGDWFFQVKAGVGKGISFYVNGEFYDSKVPNMEVRLIAGFYGQAGGSAGPVSAGVNGSAGGVLVLDKSAGDWVYK